MRAARPPTGAPVLRVAVLSQGRIVEERVLERRARVTVGASEDCTFVIPGPAGTPLVLFEPAGAGWDLCVASGVLGRVARDAHVVDLASLGAGTRVKLHGDARGRVTLGDTTFLFQLVARAPLAPRPQLPLAVKQGLAAQIDWGLTVLVALSFLLHFGLVGGMYSDWMDPIVDAGFTARLVLPPSSVPPPPVETQDEPVATASSAPAASADTPAAHAPRPGPRPASNAPAANDVDSLLRQWEKLHVVAIGVAEPGANLRRAMQPGDEGVPIDLNQLYERSSGVDDRPFALDLPHAGEPIHPGPTQDPSEWLRHHDTSPVTSTAGTVKPVVPFTLQQDPPQTTVTLANAESVIRRQLQPRARACYQRAVNADASLPDGSVLVSIRVAPSGEVASAGIAQRTGLSAQVGACIAGAAQRLVFDAPGPAGAVVTVPMHFVKQ